MPIGFEELLWPSLERNVNFSILTALHGIHYTLDEAYKERVRPYVEKYVDI